MLLTHNCVRKQIQRYLHKNNIVHFVPHNIKRKPLKSSGFLTANKVLFNGKKTQIGSKNILYKQILDENL